MWIKTNKRGEKLANYYDILGVSKSSSQSEIKKALEKAMEYHPIEIKIILKLKRNLKK